MSYCRLGPSGAYVWGGAGKDGGFICCMACRLAPNLDCWYHDLYFHSRTALLQHLRFHKKAGHRIPRSAFRRLRAERKEYGDSTREAQADGFCSWRDGKEEMEYNDEQS